MSTQRDIAVWHQITVVAFDRLAALDTDVRRNEHRVGVPLLAKSICHDLEGVRFSFKIENKAFSGVYRFGSPTSDSPRAL